MVNRPPSVPGWRTRSISGISRPAVSDYDSVSLNPQPSRTSAKLTLSKSRDRSSSSSIFKVIFFPLSETAPPDFTSLSLYPHAKQFVAMMMIF